MVVRYTLQAKDGRNGRAPSTSAVRSCEHEDNVVTIATEARKATQTTAHSGPMSPLPDEFAVTSVGLPK